MIPIVSIFNLFATFITFGMFLLLKGVYKKSGNENIKSFSYLYLFQSVFLFLIAVPGILVFDETLIAYAAAFSYLFLYFSLAYIVKIPIVFDQKIREYAFKTIIVLGVIFLFANILFIQPAERIDSENFFFYLVQENGLLRITVGLIPFLIGAVVFGSFFVEGNRAKSSGNTISTHKSFAIAFGFLILIISAGINFFLPPTPLSFVVASIVNIAGWLTIFKGITTS